MKCMNRKHFLSLALCTMMGFAGCASAADADTKEPAKEANVGLVQLVDQTSLNIIREAIVDEFAKQGYEEGKNLNLNYQNAAGNPSSLQTICSQFAGENDDVIVAIATGAAQSAQNYASEIPLVFSAVSDPLSAGLVEDLDHPGGNITGTSNEIQTDQILDLIGEVCPDAKVIGALYTPGEVNGIFTLNHFKDEAAKRGYTVVEKTGTDLTTLQQAEDVLLKDVDVLFSPNDNIVASGMSALSESAIQAGVPYFVAADSMVMDGGLGTVGIDYEELGRETARMAVNVIEGTKAGDIPVKVFRDNLNTYINEETAKRLNLNLPDSVTGREHLVMIQND